MPMIENRAKQVKQYTRVHINVFPFALASTLLMWLVSFFVLCRQALANFGPSLDDDSLHAPRLHTTWHRGKYITCHRKANNETSQLYSLYSHRGWGLHAILPLREKLTCSICSDAKFFIEVMLD